MELLLPHVMEPYAIPILIILVLENRVFETTFVPRNDPPKGFTSTMLMPPGHIIRF